MNVSGQSMGGKHFNEGYEWFREVSAAVRLIVHFNHTSNTNWMASNIPILIFDFA